MKTGKKLGLDTILKEIKSGLNPTQISKKYSIPKQTLSYSVDKLKRMGCVEKVSYGTWRFIKEVLNQPKDTLKVNSDFKEIRGHAFIWNVEFLEDGYDWKQIVKNFKKRYKKPTLSFKMICNGKVPRTIFKNRKIWLTKSGLTIYEPLDFLGKSSFTVKGTAVFEMDRLIKALIKKLGLKFQYYRFKCSREHFAHVHNQMARQFNDRKQKIKVEWDGKWFWIDFSDGINEEETNNANVSRQAQKHYLSQLKTKFAVTPEVILENFKESAKQIKQVVKMRNKDFKMVGKFGKEIAVHIPVYEGMRMEAKGIKESNKLLISAITDLKKEIGNINKNSKM